MKKYAKTQKKLSKFCKNKKIKQDQNLNKRDLLVLCRSSYIYLTEKIQKNL